VNRSAGEADPGPKHPREWDAGTYHRVSTPQQSWGQRVLERLLLRGGERVLDAGCGTGRVTLSLLQRLRAAGAAGGRVHAIDRSVEMARVARRTLPPDVPVVGADLLALPFRRTYDLVFSTATFHWVLDPAALYRSVAGVLRPGGRLHAQCGGEGNLSRFMAGVRSLAATPRYSARFAGWSDPWLFLAPEAAERHLRAAGFTTVRAWLEPEPTPFASREDYRVFVERVVLGAWMARFGDSPEEAAEFLDTLCDAAANDDAPYQLDYVRLNIEATMPPEGA
jgi:trans-aconitate 2-methyltransferase